MFVSLPQYEFPIPVGLGDPHAKHWRIVELTLHAPWFLLTLEATDPERAGVTFFHTLCVAWDHDLAEALQSLDPAKVKGLVCMMPAWSSPNGQWTSREVCEVWLRRSASGQSVMLRGADGREFDGSLGTGRLEEPAELELLLRLVPKKAGKARKLQSSAASDTARRTRPSRREAGE